MRSADTHAWITSNRRGIVAPMCQPGPLARRRFIGLHISSAPPEGRAAAGAGLPIAGVLEGGAAERAGLRAGDFLIALDDEPIRDGWHFAEIARRQGLGPRLSFRIRRNGEILEREATAPPLPPEHVVGGRVELGHVVVDGHRLRTVVTVPDGQAPRPAVLYLQGVRADSCEFPLDAGHAVPRLVEGWCQAGYLVMRVERSGVGDSEGPPPSRTDLGCEIDGYDAALESLLGRPDVDRDRVFLFGQSFGGMIAPLVALERPLAGVLVFGTSAMRWHDCAVATAARQRSLAVHADPRRSRDEVLWLEMHELVCRQGWTPERAFAEHPRLRALHSRNCDGETLYGRHVSLFQQLDGIHLAAVWRALGDAGLPVLALHGEHDWVCSARDAREIAGAAGEAAEYLEILRTGHDLFAHDSVEASIRRPGDSAWDGGVLEATVAWMCGRRCQALKSLHPPGNTQP